MSTTMQADETNEVLSRLAYVAKDGRGTVELVAGIPEEYLEMTPEQRVVWEAEVRSLYDSMVRIVVTPTWVKLIDFETTLPTQVEELVQQRAEREAAGSH